MGCFASVNGTVVPAEEARVSVLDNGFTFGDAVYETLRTYRGRPFELLRHLARLRASAARLGFAIPPDDAELGRQLGTLLARAGNSESYIRLIVSRGVGDISYHFDRVQGPTIVMVVKPLEPFPEAAYREGIAVAVVDIRRNHPMALDPAIKSCNLLNNILAVREAQTRGADEALLLNERGELAEGASTNVFVVKGGVLLTPPLGAGILAGITRDVLFGLAKGQNLPLREEPVPVEALRSADEVFVTSSTREAMPVRSIDGRPVGNGRPGPVTQKIMAAFRAYAYEGRG
jgi:branched-chain amino acid aminotransferase